MNDDDQTLAELLGLTEHDPWDKRSDEQKAFDAKLDALRQKHELPQATDDTAFDDPPDTDSLIIRDDQPGSFWRLMLKDVKLSGLIKLEPTILALSVAAANTPHGCWAALTAVRIAQKMAKRLGEQGHTVTLSHVDAQGQLLKVDS